MDNEVRTGRVSVDQLLKDYRRRYPDALARCGQLADTNGQGDRAWPDWCWLPMGGVHAYASSVSPFAVMELGKITALTLWRLGRGVYELDADVAGTSVSELWSSAGGGATQWKSARLPPLQAWTQLPEWCCYVRWPDDARPVDVNDTLFAPRGAFVHLEHDANSGRPELRLLIDTDGTWDGLTPVPVYLDRPNLGSAIADAGANAAAALRGATGANLRSLAGPSNITAFPGLAAWNVLPLALALIDPAAEHVGREAPQDRPRRADRRDGQWRPAPRTRTWTVTYTTTPTLRLVR